jgi:hypothetical protein
MIRSQALEPFPHVILDDVFEPERLQAAAAAWPPPYWPHWLQYDNALERKQTCNSWQHMPAPCQELLLDLLSGGWGRELGVLGLLPDAALWGGGMHSMGAGDRLDVHLDSDRHPRTQLERRLNAILFVHDVWEPAWGGELELWTPTLDAPAVLIEPRPGRLILFAAGDASYHGVAQRLHCPPDVRRKSLAAYWWGVPHAEPGQRPRARFVSTRGDHDPRKELLRELRVRFTEDRA